MTVFDVDGVTWHTDDSFDVVNRGVAFIGAAAYRADTFWSLLVGGAAGLTVIAKYEDHHITPLRLVEMVREAGTDDAASGHDGVFHGGARDAAVGNDKGI